MPNVYHPDEVFSRYVNEYGSMEAAKQAIKEAVEDAAPEPEG